MEKKVRLKKIILENFKSFQGIVEMEITPTQTSYHRGILTCVVGPNGSGKSTIADALLFCFGEKDDRSANLSNIVNENARNCSSGERDLCRASVSVEFQSSDDISKETSIIKVKRSVIINSGKVRSEYHLQSESDKHFVGISRSCLIQKLRKLLDIDLEVVDSFICKQQGSTVVRYSSTDLLGFIEKLVGTSKLAKQIDEQMQSFERATDQAIELETETILVTNQRKELAPQRLAFETYRKDQAQFCAELISFSNKERVLCEYKKARTAKVLKDIDREVKEEDGKQEISLTALNEAKKSVKALEKNISKLRSVEQSETKTLVHLEEQVTRIGSELKSTKRKLEVASKATKGKSTLIDVAKNVEKCQATAEKAVAAAEKAKSILYEVNQEISMESDDNETPKQRSEIKKLMGELQQLQRLKKEVEESHKKQITIIQKKTSEISAVEKKLNEAIADTKDSQEQLSSLKSKVSTTKEIFQMKQEEESKAQILLDKAILCVSEAREQVNKLQSEENDGQFCNKSKTGLRQKFAPILNKLHLSFHTEEKDNVNSKQHGAQIHGWINELCFCHETCETAVNAVLKRASNVLVVESRSDAIKIVQSAQDQKLGIISCDVLDELTQKYPKLPHHDDVENASSIRNKVEKGYVIPLMKCIDLIKSQFAPVFVSRLHNWFVCSTEKIAIEHKKKQQRSNFVTLDGVMFLADGELRSDPSIQQSRDDREIDYLILTKSQCGGTLAIPPTNWSRLPTMSPDDDVSTESCLSSQKNAQEAAKQRCVKNLEIAQKKEDFASSAVDRAEKERKLAEVAHRQAVSETNRQNMSQTRAEEQQQKIQEKETLLAERLEAEQEKLHSFTSKLSSISSQLATAEKKIAKSTKELGNADNDWLFRDNEFQKRKLLAEEDVARTSQISRSSDVALRAAQRAHVKAQKKHKDQELTFNSLEKLVQQSEETLDRLQTQLMDQKDKVAAAGVKLPSLLAMLDEAQALKLKHLAEFDQSSNRLKSAQKQAVKAKTELNDLKEWKTLIELRQVQIKDQLASLNLKVNTHGEIVNLRQLKKQQAPTKHHHQSSEFSDNSSSDEIEEIGIKNDMLDEEEDECSDDSDLVVQPKNNNKPNKKRVKRVIIDDDSSDDDESCDDDSTVVATKKCLKSSKTHSRTQQPKQKNNVPKKRKNQTTDMLSKAPNTDKINHSEDATNIEENEEQYQEELSVQRASLKLRQSELQKAEDNVDIGAIEKDIGLAIEEEKLQKNSQRARQAASDALHKKQLIEQHRFDRLFGSLEQINAAFADSYSSLSREGESDLRYSREPLTLFKEGVTIYAKPARSSWRVAQSLSGGQQATIGLALLFAFQFIYKSPFYLLDEVDASLDAQHAASAGLLMQQRAINENVQYIAISHRPQLYLHADRMVGTYGVPDAGSLCVAMDFQPFDGSQSPSS